MVDFNKFNRSYKLEIQSVTGETIVVIPPLTLEFDVVRNNLAKAQNADFTIYNLNEDTRKRIFRDTIDFDETTNPFRRIKFSAGYKNDGGEMMPLVFIGDIRGAYSTRERTEIKTHITCFGMPDQITTKISAPVNPGATQQQVVAMLIKQFPNVKSSTIGSLVGQASKRGSVLFGNVADILKELTNNKFYTDGEHAYILRNDEVVIGDIAYINSNSGLLGTPRRAGSLIEMDMIFEPRLKPEQQIVVESETEKVFNGQYKITGITHRGIISDAVGGDCITTVSLLAGTGFKQVFSKNTV